MSYLRKSRIRARYLFLALIIAGGGLFMADRLVTRVPSPHYERQVAAAKLMQASLEAVRDLRSARGIPINPAADPNLTGIIGEEFTALTTTLGNLEAKRTSVNPAFAALLVKYFKQAGLQTGDVVAVGASGSFPALLLATLSAAEVLGLEPIVVYSIGASSYGANLPELTFPEMLAHLNEKGLIPFELAAVSLGGEGDRGGGGLFGDGTPVMSAVAERSGAPLIRAKNVAQSVRQRLAVYDRHRRGKPVRCFVNIGGADPNFGATMASLRFPTGLTLHGPISTLDPARGLIFEYAARGVPVINLLDVRGLALQNGLPLDPLPLPRIGTGAVYHTAAHPRWPVLASLIISLGVFAVGIARDQRGAARR